MPDEGHGTEILLIKLFWYACKYWLCGGPFHLIFYLF